MPLPSQSAASRPHGHGLAEDLPLIAAMIARRRTLKWFAGAGTAALVAGCGSGGPESDSSAAAVSGSATTATPTPAATPTSSATASGAACIADPAETGGPYPADGTNSASGTTSNVLATTGIVRSAIRSSFLSTNTVATGVKLTLALTVVDVNAGCAPLAGFAVYIWCADRQGRYSLYTAAAESYLRGVQVTDANGRVTFTMIVPACYDGRWPHIHFELFSTLANATGGRYASLVSQLALPTEVCSAVYADTATYPYSATNFAKVTLASDMVFGDNSAAQIARQTPAMTGDPAEGYVATATIGLAR